ncbi:MAG: hypothetical protein ACLTHP_07925 [Lachnospiraceae bacterium]
MSRRMKFFIFLLVINFIVVVIYVIWNHLRGKEKNLSTWMKAIVMLLCPVVGPTFLCAAFLLYKLFMAQAMDLSDVVFSKERVKTFIPPDEERGRNMVSIEEALEVTDKKSLRTFMMNVIRGDYRKYLSSISLALNNEDTETAHYAASILQDVLGEFRENVQEKYQLSQVEDEQQVQHCIELIEYMNPILEQKILTNLEQNSMIERMDEVLEKAWSLEPEKISSVVYEKLCARLMEIPDYEKCGKWAQRSMEQYPGVLSSYTCQLKLFFSNGDKENFFRVMNELKASDITIDKETLELIRIFM